MLRGTGGTLSAGYRGIKSSSELRIIYYKKYGLRGLLPYSMGFY